MSEEPGAKSRVHITLELNEAFPDGCEHEDVNCV